MEDKDVGELWQTVMYWSSQPCPPPYARTYELLIRKIVQERADLRYTFPGKCTGWCAVAEALRSFGIDQETWRGKV